MLHLTNGDVAAERMRLAGIGGEIVPWRDVLHEGPVPAGRSLEDLSRVRAAFIAAQGWGELAAVERDFATRDAALARASADGREIVLWFEHDLYDQLQLAQLLDWLAAEGAGDASLVQAETYLDELAVERLPRLFAARRPLADADLDLGRRAWSAFTAADPRELDGLRRRVGTPALPFLAAALRRQLEELPAVGNGLSRTESQTLSAVARGRTRLDELYRAAHAEAEEALFLGDTVFASIVERLSGCREPLLAGDGGGAIAAPRSDRPPAERRAFWEGRVALTDAGRAVLAGRLDHVVASGVERWVGGTHLRGSASPWRWDARADAVIAV